MLSAFANTGGGVVIWGIHAPKEKAEKATPAHDAGTLEKVLKELLNDAVEPPVPGVEILPIKQSGTDRGFVVCFIPKSHYAPHRAMWAEKEYYLRVNHSSVWMPTEVLRRMFYPHTEPRLIPHVELSVGQCQYLGNTGLSIALSVDLENRGSSSAKSTYIRPVAVGNYLLKATPSPLWEERKSKNEVGFACKVTIHPGERVGFLSHWTALPALYSALADLPETLRCHFSIFSENALPLYAEVVFKHSELRRCVIGPSTMNREAMVGPLETGNHGDVHGV